MRFCQKHLPQYDGPIIEAFDAVIPPTTARYVRVKADNTGICPDWHSAAGAKAWLMAGEVVVNPVNKFKGEIFSHAYRLEEIN